MGDNTYVNKKVCLLPRLSLCELIAVCGLVRAVCSRSIDVMLLMRKDHVSLVRHMFEGVPNLRFTRVDSWDALHRGNTPTGESLVDSLEKHGYSLIPLPSVRDMDVYAIMGLGRELMHTGFTVSRNVATEHALLEKIVSAVGEAFVVMHDSGTRRIKREAITSSYPVVDVRDPAFRTPNIFDWITVLDRAIELHAIDSCFVMLADVMALRARKYVHAYASPKLPRHYRDAIIIW